LGRLRGAVRSLSSTAAFSPLDDKARIGRNSLRRDKCSSQMKGILLK
jgi:hypothetical protein